MARPSLDVLAPIIADQWGMVTTGQAEAAGVSRMTISRMASAGELTAMRHGVYKSPLHPLSDLDDLRAAWLATDPRRTREDRYADEDQVVVCDESAAHVYGIGDLPDGTVRVNAPRRLRPDTFSASTRSMDRAEWQWVDRLPVTTPRRTIEDLVRCGRWDDDQLRSLVDDAVGKGILATEEVGKSKLVLRVAPHLAPPASHQSAAQRLRDDARRRGVPANDSISEFTRSLFLAAVMERTDDWVVKGGTGMMCRFGKVRSTKDLDLFKATSDGRDSPTASASDLMRVMDEVTVGTYAFTCSSTPTSAGEGGDSRRVTVAVTSKGSRPVASFAIDVSARVYLSKEPDTTMAERSDQADIPGYPRRFRVRLYPLENQIADKVCAMYEVHNGRESTRYRDLYDLALMADQGEADGDLLVDAVREQQLRRRLAVPRPLAPPSSSWPTEYDRAMRKIADPYQQQRYATYQAAIAIVETKLGSALDRVGPLPAT